MLDDEQLRDLPGAEIVIAGRRDLAAGRRTEDAQAVLMASARLRAAGFDIPPGPALPPASHTLYELISARSPDDAHSRYNAVVARVVSFARALERAQTG